MYNVSITLTTSLFRFVPRVLSPNLTGVSTCPKCSNNPLLLTPFCDLCGRLLHVEFSYYYEHEVRPTIPIQLRNAGMTIESVVLVDFGAACTLLHGYLATALGINGTNANTIQFQGIAHTPISAYEAVIEIGIANKFYETRVFFSNDLSVGVLGMLGHSGFLDRFDVILDNVKRRVVVKEHEVLQEKQYQLCPFCQTARTNEYSRFCYQCGASLVIPSSIVNGSITPSLTANTVSQPFISVPTPTYQVASVMQVQAEQAVREEDKEEI